MKDETVAEYAVRSAFPRTNRRCFRERAKPASGPAGHRHID